MDYMLKRWELSARFLDDGHICLTNNAWRKGREKYRFESK